MSLPRYPAYKDSGVEWLGEVPEHWNVVPLKQVIAQIESGVSVNASDEPADEDEVGVLKTSCVYSGYFDANENKTVIEAEIGRVSCPLKSETLIVSRMNTPELVGAAGLVKSAPQNIYLPDRLWQVSFSNANPTFVYYWTQSILYRAQIRVACAGTSSSMQNLGQDQFRSFNFPNPPQAEQQAIAAFLDRETGKIDALIAEQRRLVELLAEKRQAVISHAVTKGLNPNARMKDSGIAWLGEVPENWEVPYFGLLISKAELGENHESAEGNEGIPVMKMGNLDRGFIKLLKVEYLPEGVDISKSMVLRDGDFLFNTRNSLDLVGKVAIWRGELPMATYNSNILRIVFDSLKVSTSAFMNYFFNSDLGLSQLRSLSKGTTSVAAIYYKDLRTLRVILPPPAEQRSIVTHLDNVCAQLDTLTAEANRAIALLQDRRSALISAAVTGKIDVRKAA